MVHHATIASEVAPDLSCCCRGQRWLLDEEPLCRTMGSEAEAASSGAAASTATRPFASGPGLARSHRANFWALDSADGRLSGLDGAHWLIEGRRRNVYRAISRWSPRGELHALGRLFFDLARPAAVGS